MICPKDYDFSCMVITLHSCARPPSQCSLLECWRSMARCKELLLFLVDSPPLPLPEVNQEFMAPKPVDYRPQRDQLYDSLPQWSDSRFQRAFRLSKGRFATTFFWTTTRIQFRKYCYFYCWNELMQLCRKYVCTGPLQAWQYGYLGLGIAHMWPALPAPACN